MDQIITTLFLVLIVVGFIIGMSGPRKKKKKLPKVIQRFLANRCYDYYLPPGSDGWDPINNLITCRSVYGTKDRKYNFKFEDEGGVRFFELESSYNDTFIIGQVYQVGTRIYPK